MEVQIGIVLQERSNMKTREIVLASILIVAFILALYYAQLTIESEQATKKKKKPKLKAVPIELEEEEEEEEEEETEEEETTE